MLEEYIENLRSKIRESSDKRLWKETKKVGSKLLQVCQRDCISVKEKVRHTEKCDKLFEAFCILTGEEERRTMTGRHGRRDKRYMTD